MSKRKILWGVSLSAKVERLRDFVGLEGSNLMRIVAQAAEFTKSKHTSTKKVNAQIIQDWLLEHVNWGALRCPSAETLERLLQNWSQIQNNARVLELLESAVQRWGRNNLLDWPTKISVIISKTDSVSLRYVVEDLYAQMWRKMLPTPTGPLD